MTVRQERVSLSTVKVVLDADHGRADRKITLQLRLQPASPSGSFTMSCKRAEVERTQSVVMAVISASDMADGTCEVGGWLETVILNGRQLSKLPNLPVHARR